jgi:hypothetical protein
MTVNIAARKKRKSVVETKTRMTNKEITDKESFDSSSVVFI